jgi:tetratricopeptide (TPR) repeat protein
MASLLAVIMSTSQDTEGAAGESSFEALYARGKTLNRSGDHRNALMALEQALAVDPHAIVARAERARAWFHLGRHEDAFDELDELASEDPRSIASCVKAELLLAEGDFDRAAAVASRALHRHPSKKVTDALHVVRVSAWLVSGRVIDAVDEFKAIQTPVEGAAELVERLLEQLQIRRRWSEILALVEHDLARQAGAERLVRWKVVALHALGQSEDALEAIGTFDPKGLSGELVRLKASLLCDIADFAGALGILLPITDPVKDAPHDLLALRGWVHQHLAGYDHIVQSEVAYREAHRQVPEDKWYREGVAHALARLPDRGREAEREYRAIIREIEESMQRDDVDAYTACLAGWCCYCTDRLADAASYYSAALTTTQVGPTAQFDYALILLASGSRPDAQHEYSRIVASLSSMTPLRRAGFLYIALLDLRDGCDRRPELTGASETVSIQSLLLTALKDAVDVSKPAFEYLATRMRAYADTEQAALAARMQAAEDALPAATAVPTADGDTAPVFLAPAESTPCALLSPVNPLDAGLDSPLLHLSCAGDRATRALYVTDAFLAAVGVTRQDVSRSEPIVWQMVDLVGSAWAACVTESQGERLLNQWASRLLGRARALWMQQGWSTAKDAKQQALDVARLALHAARDAALVYQAVVLCMVTGQDGSVAALRNIRPDLPEATFFDIGPLQRTASPLASLEETHSEGVGEAPPAPFHYRGDNPMVKGVLRTALRIASIQDPAEQERNARLAAAGVDVLLPVDVGAGNEAQMERQLRSHDRFYLENDESILLLACNPAFYATKVLLNLSKPTVNCFAFTAASRQYGSRLGQRGDFLPRPKPEPR